MLQFISYLTSSGNVQLKDVKALALDKSLIIIENGDEEKYKNISCVVVEDEEGSQRKDGQHMLTRVITNVIERRTT